MTTNYSGYVAGAAGIIGLVQTFLGISFRQIIMIFNFAICGIRDATDGFEEELLRIYSYSSRRLR